MPLAFSNKTRRKKNRKYERPKILLLAYSNQDGWDMTVSLKGCKFEHTEL